MARTTVEIEYHIGRGAARSKAENFLREKGFKPYTSKMGGTYWALQTGKTTIYQCLRMDFEDKKFSLSAWVTGVTTDTRHKKLGEEDLSGLGRFNSKQHLRKIMREVRKLFE